MTSGRANVPAWAVGRDLIANVSIMFPTVPVFDRPSAAQAAGFSSIETWWPFDAGTPTAPERETFADGLRHAGVELFAMNSFAGETRGMALHPADEHNFLTSVRTALAICSPLGCHHHNVLLGTSQPGLPGPLDDTVIRRLVTAAELAAEHDSRLLIEPLNTIDNPSYCVDSLDLALAIVNEVRQRMSSADSIAVLFDVYHLAMQGDDPVAAVARAAGAIGHVQLADVPGRGAPGSGTVDFVGTLAALDRVGYNGSLALEYRPGFVADPWLTPTQSR